MRLVPKLSLLLLAPVSLVLALFGWLTVARERDMFETTLVEDGRLLARTVAAAVERVATVEGVAGARALVVEADEQVQKIDLRWIDLEASNLAPDVIERLRAGEEVVQLDRGRPGALRVWVPLPTRGARAALELHESREREHRYVATTVTRISLAGVALLAVSGALSFLIGVRVIGQPARLLIQKARRIGQGDLTGPIPFAARDEIGQLARAMNEMCDQLAEETRRRVAAQQQLLHADRLATVGRLASGVAHELGTPLSVILGRALLIGEDAQQDGRARDAENAQVVVAQAERMSGVIRELLDFARRGEPRDEPFDLREPLRVAGALLAPMARKADVRLVVEESAEAATTRGDPEKIGHAVTNLVVNAIQASPGGGEVRLRLSPVEARPTPDGDVPPAATWRVDVVDQGAGIAPEHLGRVFEPFFTTKDVGEGTGLGLSVAHAIVTDHGGWVEVESAPGAGARFSLFLPRHAGSLA